MDATVANLPPTLVLALVKAQRFATDGSQTTLNFEVSAGRLNGLGP